MPVAWQCLVFEAKQCVDLQEKHPSHPSGMAEQSRGSPPHAGRSPRGPAATHGSRIEANASRRDARSARPRTTADRHSAHPAVLRQYKLNTIATNLVFSYSAIRTRLSGHLAWRLLRHHRQTSPLEWRCAPTPQGKTEFARFDRPESTSVTESGALRAQSPAIGNADRTPMVAGDAVSRTSRFIAASARHSQ
jgi:hypothetical protein